jgi:hypothetical protein
MELLDQFLYEKKIQSVLLGTNEYISWNLSSEGVYSAKCAYEAQCLRKNHSPGLAKVWSIRAEPKVSLFIWLLSLWIALWTGCTQVDPLLLLWSGVRIWCAPVLWMSLCKIGLATICNLLASNVPIALNWNYIASNGGNVLQQAL